MGQHYPQFQFLIIVQLTCNTCGTYKVANKLEMMQVCNTHLYMTFEWYVHVWQF
jgi:hypothetical protein